MTEISIPSQHEKYEGLIAATKALPPLTTAVAYPCDETSLKGALEAAEAGLIKPILVGPEARGCSNQGDQVACCRTGSDPGGTRSRSRQHASQESHFFVPRRRRRRRARCESADHSNIAGRQFADTHGLLRRRHAASSQPNIETTNTGLVP
jgi:hypothetical protein